MSITQVPCKFCRSDAVVSGVCASCGQRQAPQRPRRRYAPTATPTMDVTRYAPAECRHRRWTHGKPRYVAGEMKRTDRCQGCGITREVEA